MTNPKTTVTIYISKELLKQIDTKAEAQNRKEATKSKQTYEEPTNHPSLFVGPELMREYFWQGIIILQIAFTGLDRLMTGIVKPDIEKQTFLTYVLWFTLANQAVTYLVSSTYWSTAATPSYARIVRCNNKLC